MENSFSRLWVLAYLVMAAPVFAAELKNPEGFSTPEGYVLERSDVFEFQPFLDKDTYVCTAAKKPCGTKDFGFDAIGHIRIEGKLETAWYTKARGGPVAGYLLQRNYERVVGQAGGRLAATMVGHSEQRGWMKQVHLIESPGQTKFVHVDTFSESNRLKIAVVTVGKAPDILSAAALKKEIDAQGHATLNVNFETNRADIRPADQPTLDQVVALLNSSPVLRLSVDGHTDNVGQAEANQRLSQQRAEAIVAYLIRAGIEGARLQAKGFGPSIPVADNRSDVGRAKNRRVELVKVK